VAVSLVCPEEAYYLVEIEKLLKRQIPRVADTGYEPVSLKIIDAPKKSAPHKDTGKKDMRHTKKPAARGAKPADSKRTDSKRVESRGKGRSGSRGRG
jgi:ATP-dependent RNA helicase RhlE